MSCNVKTLFIKVLSGKGQDRPLTGARAILIRNSAEKSLLATWESWEMDVINKMNDMLALANNSSLKHLSQRIGVAYVCELHYEWRA
ncbi:CLUMA_CG010944, isoform A [Clunio marinus]|uniref:CLUMA_CG010944, isoform A n=1 Tax=Clunio marinus TaxID=568069 RepID=A0A1J1IEY1_9DIPT|nr:CLUMA_CG010944, isoform A [Clunio marinus]